MTKPNGGAPAGGAVIEDPDEAQLDVLMSKLDDRIAKGLQAPLKANTDEIEKLVKQLEQHSRELNAIAKKNRERDFVGLHVTGNPEKDFSLGRLIAGATNRWQPVGEHKKYPEREVVEAAGEIRSKTAQSAGFDHLGGFVTLPAEVANEIIEELVAESICADLGVQFRFPRSAPYIIPKIQTTPSPATVDENESLGNTNAEYNRLQAHPHEFGELIEVSNRQLMFADPAFDADLRRLIAESMARKQDYYILKGSGGEGEPTGLLNMGLVNTAAVPTDYLGTGQDVTDALENLIGSLEDDNALKGLLGFAFHPQARRKLHKSKDEDGNLLFQKPVWTPGGANFSGKEGSVSAGTLYGYRYRVSTQLAGGATADMLFGNWRDVVVPMWGGIVIDTSTEAGDAYKKRQTLFRATGMMDVLLRHLESMATWSNAWNVT